MISIADIMYFFFYFKILIYIYNSEYFLIRDIEKLILKMKLPLFVKKKIIKICYDKGLIIDIKSVRFIGITKIKFTDIVLQNRNSAIESIHIGSLLFSFSLIKMLICRLDWILEITKISVSHPSLSSSAVELSNVDFILSYKSKLLLMKLNLNGLVTAFIQKEQQKLYDEYYCELNSINISDFISLLTPVFISPLLRNSIFIGSFSFCSYLKYHRTVNKSSVPFFNASLNTENLQLIDDYIICETDQKVSINFTNLKHYLKYRYTKLDNGYDYTEYNCIPSKLMDILIFTEDPLFLQHKGIAPEFIGYAISENIKKRKIARGASTITMQLSRNLFLSHERTFVRKIEESVISLLLENYYRISKEEIFELYINLIEFAPNIYGVSNAAEFYFDKKVNELTFIEMLVLSYITPRPIHFYEALLSETLQLKNNLKKHIHRYSLLINNSKIWIS